MPGDGINNSGRSVIDAPDAAVATGITIHGLAIINEHPRDGTPLAHIQSLDGLANYYRQNVSGGLGAFVPQVIGFGTFPDSMTQS